MNEDSGNQEQKGEVVEIRVFGKDFNVSRFSIDPSQETVIILADSEYDSSS
jgi:hypothetical protein